MAAFPVRQPDMQLFLRRNNFLLRSFISLAAFFACLAVHPVGLAAVYAQGQATGEAATKQEPQKTEKLDKNQKNFTAEQVAESVIFIYGTRPLLTQIRRNGVERGRICKPTCELPGKTEEATYERRFVRGEKSEKDKVRVDQKMPTLEYSLIYGDGRLWGIINGASFTPRKDAADTFLSQQRHSLDKLLRYKENGSKLTLVGRDKQKGLDLFIIDVLGEDKQNTRYFISARTLHVVWLEYEDSASGGAPVKFRRTFHDHRYAQGTLVPFKTVLLQDGSQTQETKILTVTYGIKLDESLFKSPEA
jgi:hypothetical protein